MTAQLSASVIDDRTLIARGTGVLAAAMGNETVMLDVAGGQYYGLDEIGGDIWRRLEMPRTFGDLVDSLVADYDADRAVIAEDVRRLLAVMAGHKVVTLS